MPNPILTAIAALADRMLASLWPANFDRELAAALADLEAERDCWEPGELHTLNLPAGGVDAPPAHPPVTPPAGNPEFDDLPVMHCPPVHFDDDDAEAWGDLIYLRALADHIFDAAYLDGIRPQPLPTQPTTPDFFKDIA